jgi:serine/threonine protein kinase
MAAVVSFSSLLALFVLLAVPQERVWRLTLLHHLLLSTLAVVSVCCCVSRVTEKGNYTELDAAHIIRQILQGVQYLHSHGKQQPPCPAHRQLTVWLATFKGL